MNFEKEIEIRWSDVDQNRHVRHSAYYDFGTHLRIKFMEENGYDSQKMDELNLGPVLFKEECSFIKEIRPNDTVRVNILRGAPSKSTLRWVFHHEIFNQEGEKCAHITARGVWMNLALRRPVRPPADMIECVLRLPEGQDFTK